MVVEQNLFLIPILCMVIKHTLERRNKKYDPTPQKRAKAKTPTIQEFKFHQMTNKISFKKTKGNISGGEKENTPHTTSIRYGFHHAGQSMKNKAHSQPVTQLT